MNSNKTTGRIIGILFITVMVTWVIGFVLIEPVISTKDFLTQIYPNKVKVIIGVLVETIEITGVIGIAVMLFPILKNYNENIARAYLSLRILESVMLIIVAISPLLLITLSREYIETGAQDNHSFQILSTLILSARTNWSHFILAVFYSFAALMFYYVLYKTKLVLRFISLWGFISAALILVVAPFEALGFEKVGLAGISMGLNELFLGVWLIIKGFRRPVIVSGFVNKK